MKSLSKGKIWLFAIGQFGWALLSGLIGSWLVYFYQPNAESIAAGQPLFIPQGTVIFGALTIIGLITAAGRIFDAITDPLVASMSDNCKSQENRRSDERHNHRQK
jgi:Na+/melibiose symporter-like transporter